MATYTTNYHLEKPDATDDFKDFRQSYNDNMDIIDNHLGGGGGGGTASDITYDGTSSGLSSTNVQDAIDEVVGDIPDELADLTDDSTHRLVTDTDLNKLNGIASGANLVTFSDFKYAGETIGNVSITSGGGGASRFPASPRQAAAPAPNFPNTRRPRAASSHTRRTSR